jgi:hypothetical protein
MTQDVYMGRRAVDSQAALALEAALKSAFEGEKRSRHGRVMPVLSGSRSGRFARRDPSVAGWGITMTSEIEVLSTAALEELGPTEEWFTPVGYPDGLALCVIDAVQSIGQRYGGVRMVVGRYCEYRAASSCDAYSDGSPELAASFGDCGGVDGWIRKIGTRNRVYARDDAPLKASVIRDAAALLVRHGALTSRDLIGSTGVAREELKRGWTNSAARVQVCHGATCLCSLAMKVSSRIA